MGICVSYCDIGCFTHQWRQKTQRHHGDSHSGGLSGSCAFIFPLDMVLEDLQACPGAVDTVRPAFRSRNGRSSVSAGLQGLQHQRSGGKRAGRFAGLILLSDICIIQ